jgi:hypothetical protein
MSSKILLWDPNKGLLSLSTAENGDVLGQHKARPGSQGHELICALADGPLPRERLIRRVFAMKGIEGEETQKQLESQLRTLVSRINKDLGEKLIVTELGAYHFDLQRVSVQVSKISSVK